MLAEALGSRKFIDAVLSGEALLEDVDNYVALWHENYNGVPLHEFLGLSMEEYASWVEEEDTLRLVVAARYNRRDFKEEVESFYNSYLVAARSTMGGDFKEIVDWLRRTGRIE